MKPIVRVGVQRTAYNSDRILASYYAVEGKDFIEGIHNCLKKEFEYPLSSTESIKHVEVKLIDNVFLQKENESHS